MTQMIRSVVTYACVRMRLLSPLIIAMRQRLGFQQRQTMRLLHCSGLVSTQTS
jgi:hypothetical protein